MKRKLIICLVFLMIVYIPSVIKKVSMDQQIKELNQIKDSVATTDLSNIKVHGFVLGDNLENDFFPEFTQENNKIFEINADINYPDVSVNDRLVTSVDEVISILGKKYTTAFDMSYYNNTFTYIDHKNNIEVQVANIYLNEHSPYIRIQQIDRNYKEQYSSFTLFQLNGMGIRWRLLDITTYPFELMVKERFIDNRGLILMPLIYFIMLIPTMLAMLSDRYRVFNLILQFSIILTIFLLLPLSIMMYL